MKTYDEKTFELIENPDLSAGCTYPGKRYVGTERVILRGTVALYPPSGLGYDKPVYEDCLFFHPWEPGEKPGTDPQPSDVETRLANLEDQLTATKILLGVE